MSDYRAILTKAIIALNARLTHVAKAEKGHDERSKAAADAIRTIDQCGSVRKRIEDALQWPPHMVLTEMQTKETQWEKVINDAAMCEAQCSQLAHVQSPSPFVSLGLTDAHVAHVDRLVDQLMMHLKDPTASLPRINVDDAIFDFGQLRRIEYQSNV